MAKINVPQSPRLLSTRYSDLRGIDISCSPKEVNRKHSPDMLNMISDDGGSPRKRKGWRDLAIIPAGTKVLDMLVVDGILYISTDVNIYKAKLKKPMNYPDVNIASGIDFGKPLYAENEFTFENINLFAFNGKCYACGYGTIDFDIMEKDSSLEVSGKSKGYFFCDVDKLEFDFVVNSTLPNVFFVREHHAKTIPDVAISKNPDGTGGKDIGEGVNLLTPYRRMSYLGDGKSKYIWLRPKKPKEQPNQAPDEDKNFYIVNVEKLNDKGEWEKEGYASINGIWKNGYSQNGKLESYHLLSPVISVDAVESPITGQDNIRITYAQFDTEKGRIDEATGKWIKDDKGEFKGFYNENYASLCKGGKIRNYGFANNDRVFAVAGGNRVYYSAVSDATYIPDNNYINVANADNIVNLHKYDDSLVAVTGNTQNESSLYFINGSKLTDGKEAFLLSTSSVTVGAVASGSFSTLIDDPLFLSTTGVYSISNHFMSSQLAVRNRSTFINKELTQSANLENAKAIEWNTYYILSVDGKCYVLDGRQKTRVNNNSSDFSYEAYVFDNISVDVWCAYKDRLLFSTGRNICCFNTDIEGETAYRDGGRMNPNVGNHMLPLEDRQPFIVNGEPIKAHWTTPADYDGSETMYKTLQKKGHVLILDDSTPSEVDVYLVVDGKPKQFIVTAKGSATDIHIKKKQKKYRHMQIRLECNGLDKAFRLISLTKTYTIGNFSK